MNPYAPDLTYPAVAYAALEPSGPAPVTDTLAMWAVLSSVFLGPIGLVVSVIAVVKYQRVGGGMLGMAITGLVISLLTAVAWALVVVMIVAAAAYV